MTPASVAAFACVAFAASTVVGAMPTYANAAAADASTGASTIAQSSPQSSQKKDGEKKKPRRRGRVAVVVVDPVTQGPLAETVPVYGRLVSRQGGRIAARVRGAVDTVNAFVGDRVNKGDVLVALVSDSLAATRDLKRAELIEVRAKVRTARAELDLARQELARLNRLKKSAAFSQARYEDKQKDVTRAQSVLAEATAQVNQGEAELRLAQIALDYAVIRAPYSGVIRQRHTDVGAFLNVGDPVVSIIDDRALEVEAEVPAARISGLPPGKVIDMAFENGTRFSGVVRAVVPAENALARTRTVRFTPEQTDALNEAAVNQSVLLRVPAGAARTVVSVHKDAVLRRDGATIVFIANGDKAVRRTVDLGPAIGNRFEVLDGIKPGDAVIVRGNERLRPNQSIRIQPAGDAPRKRNQKPGINPSAKPGAQPVRG